MEFDCITVVFVSSELLSAIKVDVETMKSVKNIGNHLNAEYNQLRPVIPTKEDNVGNEYK